VWSGAKAGPEQENDKRQWQNDFDEYAKEYSKASSCAFRCSALSVFHKVAYQATYDYKYDKPGNHNYRAFNIDCILC